MLSEFHFLRPWWLLATLPLLSLLWFVARRHRFGGAWSRFCDPELLPFVLVGGGAGAPHTPWPLLALGGLTMIVALAGPTSERLPAPVFRDQSALVVVLDLSRSMNAADLNPSRLERARFKLTDLLVLRRQGQTGLVVYAADAFVVTPLTDDAGTIAAQIPVLKSDLMPGQGSAPAKAVQRAGALLTQAGIATGDILLISDGMGPAQTAEAIAALDGRRFRVSVLGVGTPKGAPIPQERGGFIQDAAGNTVVERLREPALRELASAGGGLYRRAGTDDADVLALTAFFAGHSAHDTALAAGLVTDRWREFGPWLLLPLLPLAAAGFRRGVLVLGLCMIATGTVPRAAEAGWWFTPDQQGQRAFAGQHYTAAASQFEDPLWRAAALYRAGDFAGALTALEGIETPAATYNRGNALARLGRFTEAIAAYGETLATLPSHTDARYNKALLERALAPEAPPPSADADGDTATPAQPGGDGDGAAGSGNGRAGPGAEGADGTDDAAAAAPARGEDATDAPAAAAEDAGAPALDPHDPERAQATEQWLRRIPDDPGGLLRRKFSFEQQKKRTAGSGGTNPW